jgi:hypothetical protein
MTCSGSDCFLSFLVCGRRGLYWPSDATNDGRPFFLSSLVFYLIIQMPIKNPLMPPSRSLDSQRRTNFSFSFGCLLIALNCLAALFPTGFSLVGRALYDDGGAHLPPHSSPRVRKCLVAPQRRPYKDASRFVFFSWPLQV